jgi:hypothetical protein
MSAGFLLPRHSQNIARMLMALPWPGPAPVWPALAMALVESVDGHMAETGPLEPSQYLLNCGYLGIESGLLPADIAGSSRDGGSVPLSSKVIF